MAEGKDECKGATQEDGHAPSEEMVSTATALAEALRRRGMWCYIGAVCLLLVAASLVGIGIYVFLNARKYSEVSTEEEAQLMMDLERLTENVRASVSEEARAQAHYVLHQELYTLVSLLSATANSVEKLVTGDAKLQDLNTLERYLPESVKVLSAAAMDQEIQHLNTLVLRAFDFGLGLKESYTEKASQALARELQASSVPVEEMSEVWQRVFELLEDQRSSLAAAAAEGAHLELAPEDKLSLLRSTSFIMAELPQIRSAMEEARDRWMRIQLTTPERQETRWLLEEQRQELLEKLDQLDAERDHLRLMSWLPELTIRTGIVVLLLFLTGLAASLVRYLIRLGSYYHGTADALHLSVLPEPDKWTPERFGGLQNSFWPQGIVVEGTPLPYESESFLKGVRSMFQK